MIFTDKEKEYNFHINISKLSKRELRYFNIMRTKSGVLYIKSEPGIAKSATIRSIAEKMEMNYIDLRLSMRDETDLGLYPNKVTIDNETYLDFITPLWCERANSRPTIIHFEELNRSTPHVRNAALQMLLERTIGDSFKFNDGVLMCASGNLGTEDGTDVEELDSALNNRLIHIKHELSINDWLDEFAHKNNHPIINNFIVNNPSYFIRRKDNTEGNDAYPTPRTWTMLSDYITHIYGIDSDVSEFHTDVYSIAKAYVGTSASIKLSKFIENLLKVSINDIIEKYTDMKKIVDGLSISHKAELVNSLKSIDIVNLNETEIINICEFIKDVDLEHRVSYIKDILSKDDLPSDNDNIRMLLNSTIDAIDIIRKNNSK